MDEKKEMKVLEGSIEVQKFNRTIELYATNYDGKQSMVILSPRQWRELNDFVTKHFKDAN